MHRNSCDYIRHQTRYFGLVRTIFHLTWVLNTPSHLRKWENKTKTNILKQTSCLSRWIRQVCSRRLRSLRQNRSAHSLRLNQPVFQIGQVQACSETAKTSGTRRPCSSLQRSAEQIGKIIIEILKWKICGNLKKNKLAYVIGYLEVNYLSYLIWQYLKN